MKLLHLIVAALSLACLGSTTVLAQESTCHSLVIRVVPTYPGPTSLVRARIYARPSSPEDKVFMVFGNNEQPLEINCGTASAYNNSASGLTNEAIAIPNSAAYVNDSYVTLGQFSQTTNTSGNNTVTETELYPFGSQAVRDTLFPVFGDNDNNTPSFFSYNGSQEFGWGIDSVSTPSLGVNSLPDSEGLVALAQITLPPGSPLSGVLNFKVQPNGESILPTEIATVEFNIDAIYVGLDENFGNTSGGSAGCTDETACNYSAEACIEDGSCDYLSCLGCLDAAACNYEEEAVADDGSCEYLSCQGCTDEAACNYDAEALIDDGTCVFPGCTNGCACNFDPNACEDDGSCAFEDALGNCGGICSADLDEDGICDDVDDCVGTYDACGVCNGLGAIYECGCNDVPAGDCDCNGSQLDAIGVCGGDCLQDADGNGVCDDDEILGCTVEEACNFDEGATLNDGTCDFLTCLIFGCTDSSACNYDPEATADNGTCAEFDDCDVCGGLGAIYQCGCNNIPDGDCDCDGNQLDALGICGGDCASDEDGNGVCDADQGCTYVFALNYDPSATTDDGSCEWCQADFDGDGNIDLNDLLDFLGVYSTTCQ